MSFLENMYSIFDTISTDSIFEKINNKANEVTESVKSISFDGESVRNLMAETNERMSQIFLSDDEEEGDNKQELCQNGSVGQGSVGPGAAGNGGVTGPGGARPLRVTSLSDGTDTESLPGYDENLPGYAQPSAYLDEQEVCTRRITTFRKLTEADLDESDPMYKGREDRQMTDGSKANDEDNSMVVQCFMVHMEKIKLWMLEALCMD